MFYAPVDRDMSGGQRAEPDSVVAPRSSVGEQRLSLPVLLIVELASPSAGCVGHGGQPRCVRRAGIATYCLVDTRSGEERFTALSLASGAREYAR